MDSESSRRKPTRGDEEHGPGIGVLIVDDDEIVCKSVRRVVEPFFDWTLVATTPDQAEALLAEHRVTHLLCDNMFGEGLPLGVDLIPRWRAQYPAIKRAVLYTGGQVADVSELDGVDAIIHKPGAREDFASILYGLK